MRDHAWRPLADALAGIEAPAWRRLRAAALELGAGDAVAAEAALGRVDAATDLAELRLRQRLLTAAGDAALPRAWQREAALVEAGERRADLYLRIGQRTLMEPGALDRGLTYLFWVLDHDPEHLTALRLLFEACQQGGPREALLEVAGRLLPLLDDPEDQRPVQRAVAAAWAHTDPPRAAAVLEQALGQHPGDVETVHALEGLYERLDRPGDLVRLYQDALRGRALPPAEQARVALRLGRLLEGPLADVGGALRVYADALETATPGSDVHQALEAGVARLMGQEDPTATLYGTLPSVDTRRSAGPPAAVASEPPREPSAPPPLPPVGPLPAMRRSGLLSGETGGLLAPLLPDDDDEPTTLTDVSLLEEGPAEPEALSFLGEERARPRDDDPGRAIIARKLRQARREAPWPGTDDAEISLQIEAMEQADDPDARADAALRLGERYLALGQLDAAVRALRAARGLRADDPAIEARLEEVYAIRGDWAGVADLLAARIRRLPARATDRRRALLVQLGRLQAEREPARAVEVLQEAVALGERDPAVLTTLAHALKVVRRFEEYVEVLTLAGQADPDAVPADEALTLGRVFLYQLDAPDRAAPFLLRAARVMADRVDVAADLAWARAAAGDVRLGVRLLEQAIASAAGPEGQQPRQVLRLRLARLHEELAGDLELARRAYREALRDGVRDPAVLERVERLASDARDWVTLAEVLRRSFEDARARRDGADTCKLGLRLGRLLRETLDQPVEATRVLLETYEQAPDDTDLFHLVAEGLAAHPDPAATIRLYGTRIASALLEPAERLAIGLRLVEAFSTEGRAAEAVEELDTLRALVPDDATVRAAVERLFPKAGRWADLVALYRAELRVADHAQYPVVLRKLARALEVGLRDLPAATEAWQALVEADPRDLEAVRSVARLLEAQRRFSELLLVSQREVALVAEPRQKAYIHFRIGTLHETHLGDLEAASAAYRTALKLDPRCFPALHGLRTIATDLGDWSRVLQLLGQELRLWDEPRERAAVLARMGDVHARHLGRADEAEACYRRAVDLWPACVPAARALADAAFEAGRFHEAAPLLQSRTQQKLDAWPPAARSDLFYKRGAAAMALGRVLEAIESLELALEFTPDHHEALRTLVKAVAQMGDAERLDALGARLDTVYAAHADAGREAECGRIDVLRGHVAQRALRLEQAEACYRAAAARRPHDLDAHLPLVMLHVRARRWVDATAVLRRFAEGLKPTLTDHRPDRSASSRRCSSRPTSGAMAPWIRAGPSSAAAGCFQVEPRSRTALFRMAQAHFVKKEFAEARDVCSGPSPCPTSRSRPRSTPSTSSTWGASTRRATRTPQGPRSCTSAPCRSIRAAPPRCWGCCGLQGRARPRGRRRSAAGVGPRAHRGARRGRSRPRRPEAARGGHPPAPRRHGGAAALLTPLADGGGPARDARFALAQVGLAQGDADAAARPLLRALDEDVTDTEALRALAELLGRHGDDERLFQVLSALEPSRPSPPKSRPASRRCRRAPAWPATGPPRPDRRGAAPAGGPPSFQSPLVALVGLCEPALAERFPLADLEVPPRSALVTSRRHPFAPDARAVQALLDWRDFDAYLADAPEPIRLRPAPRAVVVIGGAGRGLTAAHQRFYLGRASAFGALGLGRLHDLGPERSLELLGLLAALFDRAQPDPLAALPPRAAEAVRALVAQAGGAPLPAAHTGEAVLSGIVRTADRVGLLAAGRLRAAVEGVAGIGAVLPVRGDLTWAVRSRSRLQDLVKYALSESHRQVRHALGLAI
ncbi:MAG: hypothetical protein R3F43_05305 [bacterium]